MNFKENRLAFLLMLIPLSLSICAFIPHHEEFTTTGDIDSVNKIGTNGHVNFVYVRSGVTKNWYEKLALSFVYDNKINFQPVDKEEVAYEEEAEWREDAINHAIEAAARITHQPVTAFDDTKKRLLAETEIYTGDSFGLMVGLGLIEERTGEDFTKRGAYMIAGTGALEDDQYVGSVGAIREKLLTAQQNNVDYFFIPKDKEWTPPGEISNQEEAERIVQEHRMKLQLVPVDTIDEALAFLRALP
ncbi:S16 family serine protease [Aneurinibacillus uraniidurans]|uniref:S16 family serine protease n=1 Tax=Aneurinibacillus uraniidurans TaxID=2966586 RepID=UPI002349C182|nr:S16 family serine protease [Aneurinibacillus sp. B1]WCN38576.1 hypothetical protein PO771_04015 [Aneurinibacillus sp. B1]